MDQSTRPHRPGIATGTANLERETACLLAVIGVLRDGRKELLALVPGYRTLTESRDAVPRGLKARGLEAPRLVVADGAAGVWAAAPSAWPRRGAGAAGTMPS